MLRDLFIKDFAIIDSLHLSFPEGLNVLSGETGAGKSIIVGALNLLLGEMAEMLLTGQHAVPAAADKAGYRFKFPLLKESLADCTSSPSASVLMSGRET